LIFSFFFFLLLEDDDDDDDSSCEQVLDVVMMDTGYIMCMAGSRDKITLLWIWRRSQVMPWF
jgi:hypothetical protein